MISCIYTLLQREVLIIDKLLTAQSTPELLNLYADILRELNSRGVVRTFNSPVGDYAEWLVSTKMHLKLETNSTKGYDAIDETNLAKYQVKSRWERDGVSSSKRRALNVIRNYEDNQFDYLIIVIFDDNFNVKEAYSIPHEIIKDYCKYRAHQNGYIVVASGPILNDPRTINITNLLQ